MDDTMRQEAIMQFGARVKHYRKKSSKKSREKLAELVELGTATIEHIEKGDMKQGASLINVIEIANALKVKVGDLLGEGDYDILDDLNTSKNSDIDEYEELEKYSDYLKGEGKYGKYDPLELAYNLSDGLHRIDGIELHNGESSLIINFARFLVLQRTIGFSTDVMTKITEVIKRENINTVPK